MLKMTLQYVYCIFFLEPVLTIKVSEAESAVPSDSDATAAARYLLFINV